MRRVRAPPLSKSHSSGAIAAPGTVQSPPTTAVVYPYKIFSYNTRVSFTELPDHKPTRSLDRSIMSLDHYNKNSSGMGAAVPLTWWYCSCGGITANWPPAVLCAGIAAVLSVVMR